MCLTFFILDQETGLYERFEEFHEQKSYEIDYLIDILHKTGFKVLNVHGELNMEEPKEEDHKVFIIAKK